MKGDFLGKTCGATRLEIGVPKRSLKTTDARWAGFFVTLGFFNQSSKVRQKYVPQVLLQRSLSQVLLQRSLLLKSFGGVVPLEKSGAPHLFHRKCQLMKLSKRSHM